MPNEMNLYTFTLEDADGDTWEERIEGETVELARKKLADLQRRAVKYGSAEVVSLTEGAVPKSKKRSAEELQEYYTQPDDGMRIVGILPSDAQLEEARKRIEDGENKDDVFDELADTKLLAEAELFANK